MYCTTIETSGHGHEICIGIHMISSAIWGKSAQLNYTKTNPICGLWKIYECWFIQNCTRQIHVITCYYMRKFDLLFLFYVSPLVPLPAYKWQPRPRLVNILTGEYWWIITQYVEICLLKTDAFCHFTCLSTAATERNTTAIKITLFCFVWVLVEESVAMRDSLMAVFVVHASFYSRVREKT